MTDQERINELVEEVSKVRYELDTAIDRSTYHSASVAFHYVEQWARAFVWCCRKDLDRVQLMIEALDKERNRIERQCD